MAKKGKQLQKFFCTICKEYFVFPEYKDFKACGHDDRKTARLRPDIPEQRAHRKGFLNVAGW